MRQINLLLMLTLGYAAACLTPFPKQPATQPAPGPGAAKGPHPRASAAKLPPPTDGFLAGAHILISYKGATRTKATRTKAKALALAKKIAATLQGGVTADRFAAAAREHSDGPSAIQGGDLGTWKPGSMVPAFDTAILGLQFGGVTGEPIETPFGYHVIMRYRVLPDVRLAAAHVLVSYKGAVRAPSTVTRDRAQADARCKMVSKLAVSADQAAFSKLAKRFSDAPDKASGGRLPAWSARGRRMPSSISHAVHALALGKTSAPVRSPFGCHVFFRLAPPPIYAGSHILIAYAGAKRAKLTVLRSKAEALALATKLIAELGKVDKGKGKKGKGKRAADVARAFAKLASKHSNGPSATRGGRLDDWPKGRMAPAFDAAVGKLAIGQYTEKPVETPFGYHVILRAAPSSAVAPGGS